jgi:hypothetical protein
MTAAYPELATLESEMLWPDLARELVHLSLPSGGRRPTLAKIIEDYKLDVDGLAKVLESPRFRKMLESEAAGAKELGRRAGYVLKAEAILSVLAEELCRRARSEHATMADVTRAFAAVSQSIAGVSPAQDKAGPGGVSVVINIPVLRNDKLRYLESGVRVQADGDGPGPA